MKGSLHALLVLLVTAGVFWLARGPRSNVGPDLPGPGRSPMAPDSPAESEPRFVLPGHPGPGAKRKDGNATESETLNLAPVHALVVDEYRGEPVPFVTLQVIDKNGIEAIVTTNARGQVLSDEYLAAGSAEVRVVEGLGAPVYSLPPADPSDPNFVGAPNERLLKILRPRFRATIAGSEGKPAEWRIESSRMVPVQVEGLPSNSSPVRARFSVPARGTIEDLGLIRLEDLEDSLGNSVRVGPRRRGATHVLELRLLVRKELMHKQGVGNPDLRPTYGFRPDAQLERHSPWSAARAHLPSASRVCAFEAQTESSFFVGKCAPKSLPAIGDAPLVASMQRIVEQDSDLVRADLERLFPGPLGARVHFSWLRFRSAQGPGLPATKAEWEGSVEGVVTSESHTYSGGVTVNLEAARAPHPAWRTLSTHVVWKRIEGRTVGSYRFSDLPPGDYWLEVQPGGLEHAAPHRQPIAVPPGQVPVRAAPSEVRDRSERQTLRLHVLGTDGRAVDHLDVTLTVSIQGKERVWSRLLHASERSQDGTFLITERLPGGSDFSLELHSLGYATTILRRRDFESGRGGFITSVRLAARPSDPEPMGGRPGR